MEISSISFKSESLSDTAQDSRMVEHKWNTNTLIGGEGQRRVFLDFFDGRMLQNSIVNGLSKGRSGKGREGVKDLVRYANQ